MPASPVPILLLRAMNESAQNGTKMAAVKEELISLKPSAHTITPHFFALQNDVFTLLDEPSNNPSKRNIQAADALLIWYLRASQAIKAGASVDSIPADAIFSDRVFNWAILSLNFSHGAQANAALGLLRRLIQLLLQTNRKNAAELCSKWAISVFSSPTMRKEHFQIIETLAKECPEVSQGIQKAYPDFVELLMSSCEAGAVANAAAKCVAALLQNLISDFSENDFVKYWAQAIAPELKNPKLASNLIQHALPILLRLTPNSIEIFIKNHIDVSRPELLLSVLNVSQKTSKSKGPMDSGLLTYEQMDDLLKSDTESIRLGALQLLVSTIKTSRPISMHVQNLLIDHHVLAGFVENSRSAETRDAFSSIIRKAVISLRDCFNHNSNSIESARSTINSLLGYFHSVISPSASYLLLLIAFNFLEVLLEEGYDGRIGKKTDNDQQLHATVYHDKLVYFTTNNHEDIRTKARKLLQRLGEIKLFVDLKPDLFHQYIGNSLESLKSVQGRKSDEHVNLLMLVAFHCNRSHSLLDFLGLARQKLLQVGRASPHGFYTFFAKFFQDYLTFIADNEEFTKELVKELLQSCQNLWAQYKTNTTFETLEDSEGMEASSWRPIRESTLLLNTIIKINETAPYELWKIEDFLEVCELTRDQLGNITHRGVFMAVFNTYVSACCACLDNKSLRELPMKWLDESLDLVKGKTQFVSRRSGGLPFLITGVLDAFKKGGQIDEPLEHVMRELTNYTQIPLRDEDRAKTGFPQVHAFNCIKHLFLDSMIYSSAKKYLNDTLSLALDNIESTEWSIKNSALMLFTSLQNRIFGTNMILNTPSGMKASVFFGIYRGLAEKFYTRLSSFGSGSGSSVESVLSILTILERLEWEGYETEHANLLHELLLNQYLNHRRWKIRQMTARVMCKMVVKSELEKSIHEAFSRIASSGSLNIIHGSLLLAFKLYQRGATLKDQVLIETFEVLTRKLNWQVLSVFFDILLQQLPLVLVLQLSDLFVEQLLEKEPYPAGAKYSALAKLSQTLHKYHLQKGELENAEDVLLIALQSSSHELQRSALQLCDNGEVSSRVLEAIQLLVEDEKTWSDVRVQAVTILVKNGQSVREPLPDIYWSEELQVLDLVSQEWPEVQKLQKFLHPHQSEEIRLLCIYAIGRVLSSGQNLDERYFEDLIVLLLLASTGDSRPVRRRSADYLCEIFNLNKAWSTSFTFSCAIEAHSQFRADEKSVLGQFLGLFRSDFADFAKKELFDLDKDDLYMDSVSVHRKFSLMVGSVDLSADVDELIKLIQKNPAFMAWEYDFLFYVGCAKLRNLGGSSIHPLDEELKKIGYRD